MRSCAATKEATSATSGWLEMRHRPTCWVCRTTFTRASNMRSHMKKKHGIIQRSVLNGPTFGQTTFQPPIIEFNRPEFQIGNPFTNADPGLDRLYKITKLIPQAKIAKTFGDNIEYRNRIAMYEREMAKLKSESWIISKSEIKGFCGYVCRRCNTIESGPIRDVGYDMTMQTRHICNEDKVKKIKMDSIRPLDIWRTYDSAAGIIQATLNRLMTGQKYIIAIDASGMFESLESLMDPLIVKTLIGIPDRYYMYTVKSTEKIPWLERATNNLGMRCIVDDAEIRDFLRRAQASYAFFETMSDKIVKRYLIIITT